MGDYVIQGKTIDEVKALTGLNSGQSNRKKTLKKRMSNIE